MSEEKEFTDKIWKEIYGEYDTDLEYQLSTVLDLWNKVREEYKDIGIDLKICHDCQGSGCEKCNHGGYM
jgi:hypothetical protein